MKTIKWHNHARVRLIERDLDTKLVQNSLAEPDQIIGKGLYKIIHKRYKDSHNSKEYLLRIFVEDHQGEWVILSAYRTSKIEKYWRDKI